MTLYPPEDKAPSQQRMGLLQFTQLYLHFTQPSSDTLPLPPPYYPQNRTARDGRQAARTPLLLPAVSQERPPRQQTTGFKLPPGFKPSLISGGLTPPSSTGTFTIIPTHGYHFSFGPW